MWNEILEKRYQTLLALIKQNPAQAVTPRLEAELDFVTDNLFHVYLDNPDLTSYQRITDLLDLFLNALFEKMPINRLKRSWLVSWI